MGAMFLSGTGGISGIVDAMGDVLGLVTTIVETMTGQPLLLFFLAAGLVPVGIGLFRGLKRAAKS